VNFLLHARRKWSRTLFWGGGGSLWHERKFACKFSSIWFLRAAGLWAA